MNSRIKAYRRRFMEFRQYVEFCADGEANQRWLENAKPLPRWLLIGATLWDMAFFAVRVRFCDHDYQEIHSDYDGGFAMRCTRCGHGFSGRF